MIRKVEKKKPQDLSQLVPEGKLNARDAFYLKRYATPA